MISNHLKRSIFACGIALLAAVATTGCRGTTRPGPQPAAAAKAISDERRQLHVESFDKVWLTIRDSHWDPNLNGVDWDAARAELRPRVEAAQTDAQARAAMQELIGRLKQSHFGIIPADVYNRVSELPAKQAEDQEQAAAAKTPPAATTEAAPTRRPEGESGVRVRVVGAKALVTQVDEGSAGAVAGVRPGWELLSVGKFKVDKVLKLLRAAHAGSSLLPAYLSLGAEGLLDGDEGETVQARFRDGRGRTVNKQITLQKPAGNAAKFGNLPTVYIRTIVREPSPGVGYVWFTAFLDTGNVMSAYRQAIERFKDADGLIIDLRGNPGGIGFMANGMSGYLVDQPNLQLGEMSMRGPAGPTKLKFVVNPQPTVFKGPVAILVDECSMSTSEIMAGGLKDIGRARVFGTPTPGAALPSVIDRLPNGDGFQYAFANYVSAKGDVLEARGVRPDEVVPLDQRTLLAGKDPVIEAAVRWIRSQKRPSAPTAAVAPAGTD